MRIALAQMKNIENMQDNLDKSIEQIREAAQNNADLILFPEVQLTEFFPQYEGRDGLLRRIDRGGCQWKCGRKSRRSGTDHICGY